MPMVIRAPFGGNVRTPELHSDAHEAKYANAPGLKVVMPATARDAKGMLAEAIRDPDPVLFCEPLRGYRLIKDEVPEEDYTVPLGKARVVREGSDLVIVAYSAAVVIAERAADRAAEEGYSVGVLDLRSLVPLDVDALREAVAALRARGRPARGLADRGLRRRARGDDPGGGLLVAAGAHRPRRRPRHAVPAGHDRGALRALGRPRARRHPAAMEA